MDYFTAISTSSFQDMPPPAANSARGDAGTQGASSFDKHLSDNLNQSAQAAEKPSPVKNQPNDTPKAETQPSGAPAKPDAPKQSAATEAPNKPATPDAPLKADAVETTGINDTAAQKPTPLGQNIKAALIAATAENSDATATVGIEEPADLTPEMATAFTPAPQQQPAGQIVSASAGQKADKASADQKAEDASRASDTGDNGLALGAIGISVPTIIQNLKQPAPSPEGIAAIQSSATNPLPGMSGELQAEAAKLLKGAATPETSDTGTDLTAQDTQSDQPKAEGAPAPFAALLSAAKSGALKPGQIASENSTLSQGTHKLDIPAPLPATEPLAATKVEAPAPAEQVKKADATASLATLVTGEATKEISATKTINTATPQASEAVTADPLSAAPSTNKADAAINPLPFATLGGIGQTPFQMAQPLQQGTSSAAMAAGALYAATHVAIEITKTVNEGGNQFSIRLDPAELGRVDVKLHFESDGRVTAAVSADNQQTLDLLKRDASQLNQALLDSGLKTDQGSLSFSLRQQWQQSQGQQTFTDNTQGGGNQGQPEIPAEVAAAINSARSYVSNRALDITV